MSTTEQISAYLAWRSEREGRTIDVSPEAYERYQIVGEILDSIAEWSTSVENHPMLDRLGALLTNYYKLEDN